MLWEFVSITHTDTDKTGINDNDKAQVAFNLSFIVTG